MRNGAHSGEKDFAIFPKTSGRICEVPQIMHRRFVRDYKRPHGLFGAIIRNASLATPRQRFADEVANVVGNVKAVALRPRAGGAAMVGGGKCSNHRSMASAWSSPRRSFQRAAEAATMA